MDYQMSFSCSFNTFYMLYLKVLLDGCMVDVVDIPLWIVGYMHIMMLYHLGAWGSMTRHLWSVGQKVVMLPLHKRSCMK